MRGGHALMDARRFPPLPEGATDVRNTHRIVPLNLPL